MKKNSKKRTDINRIQFNDDGTLKSASPFINFFVSGGSVDKVNQVEEAHQGRVDERRNFLHDAYDEAVKDALVGVGAGVASFIPVVGPIVSSGIEEGYNATKKVDAAEKGEDPNLIDPNIPNMDGFDTTASNFNWKDSMMNPGEQSKFEQENPLPDKPERDGFNTVPGGTYNGGSLYAKKGGAIYANGGPLEGMNQSSITDGVTRITGREHGEDGSPGVQYGPTAFVEDDEIILTDKQGGQFVISNEPISEKTAKYFKAKKGARFSDTVAKRMKYYADRPFDPIIKAGRENDIESFIAHHKEDIPESNPEHPGFGKMNLPEGMDGTRLAATNNMLQGQAMAKFGGPLDSFLAIAKRGMSNLNDPNLLKRDPNTMGAPWAEQMEIEQDPIVGDPQENIDNFTQAGITGTLTPDSNIGNFKAAPAATPNTPTNDFTTINSGGSNKTNQSLIDGINAAADAAIDATGEKAAKGGKKYAAGLRYAPIVGAAANLIGAFSPAEVETPHTITNADKAETMDINPLLAENNKSRKTAQYALKQAISNPAMLAAAMAALNADGKGSQIAMAKQEFDTAQKDKFAATSNQVNQFNSQTKAQTDNLNAQNRGVAKGARHDAIAELSQSMGAVGTEEAYKRIISQSLPYDWKGTYLDGDNLEGVITAVAQHMMSLMQQPTKTKGKDKDIK